jgi:hypothetical protein
VIDTLAAAYAEDGKFDDALKWENNAIEIWPRWRAADASIKIAGERIELYKAGKPYWEVEKIGYQRTYQDSAWSIAARTSLSFISAVKTPTTPISSSAC